MLTLHSGANGAVVDPSIGNIADLWFGPIQPLHRAPWYGTMDGAAALAPVERRLAGDFLCLPFGRPDAPGEPIHGATANTPWELLEQERDRLRLRLLARPFGATIEWELRLAHESPLLYQTHVVEGGAGQVTLAFHPMVHMAAGGRLAFSPKRAALVPDQPLEPGRNLFAPGARTTDLAAIPARTGTADLTRYPAAAVEDFLTLVEAPGARLGWAAVTRTAEADVVFVLKDPAVLPVTMLWISNGGRDRAPWSGRHRGVLGIEDGIAAGPLGPAAAATANPVAAEGVATVLTLGPRHVIRRVIGAIPRPRGWQTVASIRREAGELVLAGDSGEARALLFAAGFL